MGSSQEMLPAKSKVGKLIRGPLELQNNPDTKKSSLQMAEHEEKH